MTTQYSVRFLNGDADAQTQRAVLATLPNRFRVVDSGNADVLVVSRAAIAEVMAEPINAATRGLFLSAPGTMSTQEFKSIRQSAADRPIGLALSVMPALTDQALTDLRMDGADAPVIVDAASEVSSAEPDALRAAVFEQLMLLHAVSGRISDLTVLARTEMQMVLDVQIDSVWKRARISVRRSFRDVATLHTISRSVRRRAKFVSDPHAEPVRVEVFDQMGCRIASPSYEGGYRRSWQKFHAALTGAADCDDVLNSAEHALRLMF
jgi:hypothetical protein